MFAAGVLVALLLEPLLEPVPLEPEPLVPPLLEPEPLVLPELLEPLVEPVPLLAPLPLLAPAWPRSRMKNATQGLLFPSLVSSLVFTRRMVLFPLLPLLTLLTGRRETMVVFIALDTPAPPPKHIPKTDTWSPTFTAGKAAVLVVPLEPDALEPDPLVLPLPELLPDPLVPEPLPEPLAVAVAIGVAVGAVVAVAELPLPLLLEPLLELPELLMLPDPLLPEPLVPLLLLEPLLVEPATGPVRNMNVWSCPLE